MSGTSTRPRWFFLITPPWLAWHAFAVAAAWGMLWLGDWQFHRAEGGNALSWAYTFEWPIFTAFGIVFWAKTVIDEYRKQGRWLPATGTAGRTARRQRSLPAAWHFPAGRMTRRPPTAPMARTTPSWPPTTLTWRGSTAAPPAAD